MYWHQKILVLVVSIFAFTSISTGQSQYVMNGNAYSTSCDCYTLTNAQNNQVGSVWNSNLIDLNNAFDMTFDIFLGCSNNGADGMVFALQPIGTNIGTTGGGMGMSGVSPAVGIYLDTYSNGVDFDPAADHLSVQINGDNVHDGSPEDLTTAIVLPNLEDCNYHSFRVIWDAAATQLSVIVDGTMYVNIVVDIVTTVFSGNPNVFWGFTAATGGLNNVQKFCIQADLLVDLSADSVCVNQNINMADSSIIAGGIVSREWDFGDSSPLEFTQNVSHSYAAPGTYNLSLNMTDVSGCVYNITSDIVVLEPVVNQLVANSACNACNGELEIQASASAGPYQYSINGGTSFQIDSVFNSLCGSQVGQIYNLVVMDQFGCQNFSSDTIFDDKPQINNVVVANSECLVNTGEVSIGTSTIGGTAPYIYSIDGFTGFQALPITNLAPIAPATYNLIVQDNFGCVDTVAVTIDIMNEPALFPVQIVNESCTGICDGSAIITGTNLVNYSIDNGVTFTSSGVFNNLCFGVYDVVVNNGFGCELFDQFTITKPSVAEPLMEANVTSGCEPLTVEFSNISTGQIAKTHWSFSNQESTSVVGAGDITHQFNTAGLKDVTMTLTTIDGCIFEEKWPQYIDVFPAPAVDYEYSPNAITIYNTEVNFTNTSSADVISWLWDFGSAVSPNTSSEENPTVFYPEGLESDYLVQLLVTNQMGCEASKKGIVTVASDVVVYSPNVFTPGTAQNNAGWAVYLSGIDIYNFHLVLYNRWGEIVWESYNPEATWDGTYGTGNIVKDGTYVWMITTNDQTTAKTHEFTGTVTVFK